MNNESSVVDDVNRSLAEYKSVHINEKNVALHFIGIPLIVLSITTLLSVAYTELIHQIGTENVVITTPVFLMICVLLTYIYYAMRQCCLSVGLLGVLSALTCVGYEISLLSYGLSLSIFLFIFGWCCQFLGHYYEGRKPAFTDDIRHLLVGPMFLMAEVYFYFGWQPERHREVSTLALSLREQKS